MPIPDARPLSKNWIYEPKVREGSVPRWNDLPWNEDPSMAPYIDPDYYAPAMPEEKSKYPSTLGRYAFTAHRRARCQELD